MKQLIISEKPSVARAVAIALSVRGKERRWYESADWIVASASGHLLEMAEPHVYDPVLEEWRAEDLPILPERFRWVPRENQEKRLETLKELIRRPDVSAVINACDAAREGELIFKLIFRWAKADKPVKRAWFSSLTSGAIRRAFEELRDDREMEGLENAAFSREIGDWLIGINGTRAASIRAGAPRGLPLSLGRVQTPALRLLAEREEEIDRYVPIPFFRVEAGLAAAPSVPAMLVDEEGEAISFEAEERARELARELEGSSARLDRYTTEVEERAAPLPFDLATLQVEASRAFGWSAQRTLATAQRLYEKRYVSYPRTDSRFLTWDLKPGIADAAGAAAEAVPEIAEAAGRVAEQARVGELSARPFNNALVRDHHAIIPTSRADFEELGEGERLLYAMVARRFVAAFYPPLRTERHEALLTSGEHRLLARGTRVLDPGWRVVEGGRIVERDPHLYAMEGFRTLQGKEDAVPVTRARAEKRYPRRPRAHTDGSLIRAMERAGANRGGGSEEEEEGDSDAAEHHVGIGTPATRAATIEVLLRRGYALRDRRTKTIFATARGRRLIESLDGMDIASPRLTSHWERRLEAIREGEEERSRFEADLRQLATTTVKDLLARPLDRVYLEDDVLGPCPRCDGRILIRENAFGCSSWKGPEDPGCGWVVFRNLRRGRVGRAEALHRLEHDLPIAGRRPVQDVPPAPPTEGNGSRTADELGLEPYEPAAELPEPLPLGDGDEASEAWMDAARRIVAAEGPVMVKRITRLLTPTSSGARPKEVKKRVNRITSRMVREGVLEEVREPRSPEGQQDRVLRLPSQPDVRPRRREVRGGLELPQSEIRAVWQRLKERSPDAGLGELARAFDIDPETAPEPVVAWLSEAVEATR